MQKGNTANKKIDVEKENIAKLNKKFKDQKNESEKQIATLKTINLDLENKVNKKNMNNEPTTCKQDQQHQQQSNREIIQKGTQEKHSIYVIDLLEQSIKDQQLQEITKKYGKVIDQEIRKDGKGKIGNIAIITFSTEELARKAITGINKTNKYIAKKYEYETSSEVLLIQEINQEKQRTELQNQKLHPVECYAFGSSNHIIKDCNKKYNIYVSYREEETLNETEMRQIIEEYGKVKKVRIKHDRYGYQQQRAMICFSIEKEAAIAIKETNKYKRWKPEEYKNFSQSKMYPENNSNEYNLKEYQKHKSHKKQRQNNSEVNNSILRVQQDTNESNETTVKETEGYEKDLVRKDLINLKNDMKEIKEALKSLLTKQWQSKHDQEIVYQPRQKETNDTRQYIQGNNPKEINSNQQKK